MVTPQPTTGPKHPLVPSVRPYVTVTRVCLYVTGTYHNTGAAALLSGAVCFLSEHRQSAPLCKSYPLSLGRPGWKLQQKPLVHDPVAFDERVPGPSTAA